MSTTINMNRHHFGFVVVVGVVLFFGSIAEAAGCPCANATDCEPIKYKGKELYGLVLNSTVKDWATYNFSKLTTIVMIDFFDIELVCMAHSYDVRVLTRETFSLDLVGNQSRADHWIKERVQFAAANYLDGIELYVDDPVAKNSPRVNQLNDFVQGVVNAFRLHSAWSVVVFSIPWSPYNEKKLPVDEKAYDYLTISKVVDQLYVMGYNQRSQSYDQPCEAGSPSNYFYMVGGLLAYKNMTMDFSKIVLGLAAFGHDYECTNYGQNLRCEIDSYAYRGAKCSDKIATLVPYSEISNLLKSHRATDFYDEHSATYKSEYFDPGYGYVHQIFYDWQNTLELKMRFADEQGARGVGVYVLNYINKYIWDYLPDYKHKPHSKTF